MKQYLLLFSLFLPVLNTAEASPPNARPRPTPVTEVYAIASAQTPLEWTVYTPSGKGPWPAVLVVHGGFFTSGDANDAGVVTCAHDLAAAGYIAFAIDYRLAPPGSIPGQHSLGRFPDQPEDVSLAVLAARDDSRTTGEVGSVGGSAGATHTAWLAATGTVAQDRPDVGVCLSGAYDFSDFRSDAGPGFFVQIVTNYVGVPSSDTNALRSASPAWMVNRAISPLYLVDSKGDLMPSVQLDDMVAQLNAAGVTNYEAMTIPGSDHSFAYWPKIKAGAIAFLAAVLNGRGR
jgi:acetyl esterase/lipase